MFDCSLNIYLYTISMIVHGIYDFYNMYWGVCKHELYTTLCIVGTCVCTPVDAPLFLGIC